METSGAALHVAGDGGANGGSGREREMVPRLAGGLFTLNVDAKGPRM